MQIKSSYPYLILAAVQLLLLYLAFPLFFTHACSTVFNNQGDGIKNYYTLYSFTKDPVINGGLFKYNYYAYPFGDYVYYTDNTPAFSLPFRWFCAHIYDCSRYAIPAYNFFALGNIILTSFLTFGIFKKFAGNNVFIWMVALALPWINMQMPRLYEGDFNLSFSMLTLIALALYIYWYEHRASKRVSILMILGMSLWIIYCFLVHGYYLAIIMSFICGMLFFAGLFYYKRSSGRRAVLISVIVALLSMAGVFFLLFATDKYLPLRQAHANGYDWSEQKTNFTLLFSHYDFHTLAFPFASVKPQGVEMMVYLGNPGLFAFLIICAGCLFSAAFRKQVYAIQKKFFSDPLKKSIFWGGLLCLSISFGEHYVVNLFPIVIYTPVHWVNDLGTVTLTWIIIALALIIYGIILLVSAAARQRLGEIKNKWVRHPFRQAGVLFFAAFAIYLFVGQYNLTLLNIFNPLLYLHHFTKRVEQFRCLARFAWPFFWTFYIWIIYTIAHIYKQSARGLKILIIVLVIVPAATEVYDYVMKFRKDANKDNLISDGHINNLKKLHIDFSKYQSVLPLPYYAIGSEDYAHTINENDDWGTFNMQLALYGHLPLMATKMSRTPPIFSIDLLTMVSTDTMPSSIKNKLNNKLVLVAFSRKLSVDSEQARSRPTDGTRAAYAAALAFPARHHLSPIDSLGDVLFYSWSPE